MGYLLCTYRFALVVVFLGLGDEASELLAEDLKGNMRKGSENFRTSNSNIPTTVGTSSEKRKPSQG